MSIDTTASPYWNVDSISGVVVCLVILSCCPLLIQAQGTINDLDHIAYQVVQPGSNFSLNCTMASNFTTINKIEWQFPHKNEPFWANFELNKEIDEEFFIPQPYKPITLRTLQKITPAQNRSAVYQTRQQDETFISILKIFNASYFDTGSYTCFTHDSNRTIIQIKEQHVFVEDHSALFVPPISLNKDSPEVIGLISQQNLTIGCPPTHPSVQMELSTVTDEKNLIATSNKNVGKDSNSSLNSSWSFSPFKGFTFNNIVTPSIIGHYECKPKVPHSLDSNSSIFEVVVYGVDVIPSYREQLVKAGFPFEITCRGRKPQQLLTDKTTSTTRMRLLWTWIPDRPINGQKNVSLTQSNLPPVTPRMTESTSKDKYSGLIYILSIKWDSIPLEASGIYQCSDSDNNTYSSASTRLKVFFDVEHLFTIGNSIDLALIREYRAFSSGYRSINKFLEVWPNVMEQTIKVGENFQIVCKGHPKFGYRIWMKAGRESDGEFYKKSLAKHLYERWSSELASRSFWTTVTVSNSSYLDTGYYFCFSTHKFNTFYRIEFIFVQDPQHLVLPPALRPVGPNRDLKVIVHYGAQFVTIGCGPTYSDVQIFLKHRYNDHIFKIIASSLTADAQSNWIFSRYEGFILKVVDSWEMKGEYVCEAKWPNQTTIANATDTFQIVVQGVEIVTLNETKFIYEGDELSLTCRSKKEGAIKLSWRWFPQGIESNINNNSIEINNATRLPAGGKGYWFPFEEAREQENPPLGKFKVHRLRWKEIPIEATGNYECYDAIDSEIPVKNISVHVLSPKPPILDDSTAVTHSVERNEQVKLVCNEIAALPKPEVQWFLVPTPYTTIGSLEEIRNDQSLTKYTISTTITADCVTSELLIHHADSDAEFRCVFSNRIGEAKKQFIIKVESLSKGEIVTIAITIFVIVTLVIVVIRWKFAQSIHRQKRMYHELVNARLKLLEGNLERINPDKPIEDQVHFLPYDPKYEFPINRLVLGKQLGAGQFGRVIQAEAIGMGPSGSNTIVAVKMVKSETDNTALSSLASELKILIHLGSHLNVVNLLGACTVNIRKGELLVIVEFCRYGNLKDFLFSKRSNFMKESINELDYSITNNDTIQNIVINHESPSSTKVNYINVQDKQQQKEPYLIPIEGIKKEESLSRKSTVCVNDLVKWTYQTACGMNYLSKRKVMHGDLAARNLLLADDDVIKIADFGLSRNIYQNCDYQKQGEEALPVKWMAIESLLDRVFSSKSDVWAFGVTMWEIFTLSQQPYPKIIGYAALIEFLQNGHRMEKPEHAPGIIGEIMTNCWKRSPNDRMTFDQLEKTLGQLVDDKTRQRFASKETEDSYVQLKLESKKVLNDYLNVSDQNEREIGTQKESINYDDVQI